MKKIKCGKPFSEFIIQLSSRLNILIIFYIGRINLVDLQQILNVDFRHIEDKVTEMVKQDKSLMLVLGQLVDK